MKYNDENFLSVAEPIIGNIEFQKMKYLMHHNASVYDHVIDVAFRSYKIAYKYKLDWKATIRGALLHDFFLYEFDKSLRIKLPIEAVLHAFNHPVLALENARKNFVLNQTEENIILSHMFPFRLPKTKESWIVSFVDKFYAAIEYSVKFKRILIAKIRCKTA